MKKYFIYISIAFLSIPFVGCDNFLTPEPTDKYSESVAFSSEQNAKIYVNSFYTILSNYGLFGSAYLGGCMYTDGLTDIVKTGGSTVGWNGAVANLYATNPGLITPDQNSLNIWTDAYEKIRRINEFLEGVVESELSDDAKLRLEAEARFFRGYLYFLLMRNHGSVILLDVPTSDPLHPRSPASDCWNFVEADLDFSATNLPKEWDLNDQGRVTKGAAYAMKSRAMLYAERWQSAFDAASEVLKLEQEGIYALGAYKNAFGSYFSNGNKESILEFRYNYPQLVHNYDVIASPGGDYRDMGGDIQPTQELVESYEKIGGGAVDWSAWHNNGVTSTPPWDTLEPRFHATVLYNGCTWKGRIIEPYEGGVDGWTAYPPAAGGNRGATITGYYMRKYVDENHIDLINRKSSQPYVEIRLGEVYLNYAEAAYHLNKISEANKGMNTIRTRVGLNTLSLTGANLLNQIKKERKLELAGEGHRYWDLRRWKDAASTITGLYVHGLKVSKVGDSFRYDYITCDNLPRQFPEKLYALPILSAELNNNPACEQIPGW